MANMFTPYLEIAHAFWQRISFKQRLLAGGIAGCIVALFVGSIIWFNKAEYRVLYSNLQAEDANRIVRMLQ
ncbi:MAG: flagellar M-ring protein FliF, partial [Deltaproteobacteria bacterium]|nr:flagellar M-ring protein FliF [Deltaproteobacteria bacterium]